MSLETVEEEALSSEAQQILDLMGSRVRVDVTDGRHIMGVLYCVDGLQNVMLEDSITVFCACGFSSLFDSGNIVFLVNL